MDTDFSVFARANRDINVIPMIDILLVLVIAAMVLLSWRMAMEAQLTPPADEARVTAGASEVTLELPDEGGFLLHGEVLTAETLLPRLREVFDGRPRKVIVVKTGGSRLYSEVIAAMDVARDAGIEVVALAP